MSLKKSIKRLRREMTANPKKAAVLGLLVAVAVFFWGPLMWGWVNKGDAAHPATVAAPIAPLGGAPGSPAQPKGTLEKTETPTIPWQQLVTLMDNDPRTMAESLATPERDPFALTKAAEAQAKPQAEAETETEDSHAAQVAATPESLGLVLSGTIIGPQRRVARISGKSYEQGKTLELTKDGQQFTFTVSKVGPRSVVLTREGTPYELTIPAPGPSSRVELSRGGN